MSKSTKRLLSLDVFRGITIAGMILVNTIVLSPFPILEHAQWHGCTFADLVFPFFLVVVGMSLVLSMSKYKQPSKSDLIYKIVRRTVIIFLLGCLLNLFPHHLTSETWVTVRVYGVLQRIALCYLFAAMINLLCSTVWQAMIFVTLLIGYWLLMIYYPVPQYGTGDLSQAGNLGAYLDRLLFNAKNLYGKVYDPEGLLSTLPAIATTLLGNLSGIWLGSRRSQTQKWVGLFIAGVLCMVGGWIWGQYFPINKALWTSSYVLWTGGFALIVYAICFVLIEIKHYVRWSKPFEIFGLNAIVAYFFHVFFFKVQLMIHVNCGNGKVCNLRQIIIQDLFGWATLPYASLYYAILSVLFWLGVLTILYKRKIFIRI
jgi:predicted acyltransferase